MISLDAPCRETCRGPRASGQGSSTVEPTCGAFEVAVRLLSILERIGLADFDADDTTPYYIEEFPGRAIEL
jgi:hypothetical protein